MTADDTKKRAQKAKSKPAQYGSDIDLEEFTFSESEAGIFEDLDDISEDDRKLVQEVGFNPDSKNVSGSYIQFDNESFHADVFSRVEGLEVLATSEALRQYDWLSDYIWKSVSVDTDKFTAASELEPYEGYFIRAKAGARIKMPVQSCLIIKKNRGVQNVHNIIIAEEDSELHIITGCATPSNVERSLHLGISEFYVKKNAQLTFTMVHKWNEQTDVRPRSSALIEEGGTFLSSYALLSSARSIQSYPKVRLIGNRARANLYSVIYGTKNSVYDVGGLLSLEAPKSNGKVISKSIATEQSEIIARGELIGLAKDTKARLECDGLLLSDEAVIRAIPMLSARAEGTELSHEATVGKVGVEQLSYLMSRGLSEEEATTLIVNGFVKLQVPDLPPALQRSIDDAVALALKGGM